MTGPRFALIRTWPDGGRLVRPLSALAFSHFRAEVFRQTDGQPPAKKVASEDFFVLGLYMDTVPVGYMNVVYLDPADDGRSTKIAATDVAPSPGDYVNRDHLSKFIDALLPHRGSSDIDTLLESDWWKVMEQGVHTRWRSWSAADIRLAGTPTVDTTSYALLGLSPPWLWPEDDFAEWWADMDAPTWSPY